MQGVYFIYIYTFYFEISLFINRNNCYPIASFLYLVLFTQPSKLAITKTTNQSQAIWCALYALCDWLHSLLIVTKQQITIKLSDQGLSSSLWLVVDFDDNHTTMSKAANHIWNFFEIYERVFLIRIECFQSHSGFRDKY